MATPPDTQTPSATPEQEIQVTITGGIVADDGETYRESREAAMKEDEVVFASKESTLTFYQALKAADLNGDGKIEGESEQEAVILKTLELDNVYAKSALKEYRGACNQPSALNADGFPAWAATESYRYFYPDKTLAKAVLEQKAGQGAAAYANELSALGLRMRQTTDQDGQWIVEKGDWTEAQLANQRKACQAIDAEMDLRAAQIRVESFTRYPEVAKAAADLPEIGNLAPLGGEVTCRAVQKIQR